MYTKPASESAHILGGGFIVTFLLCTPHMCAIFILAGSCGGIQEAHHNSKAGECVRNGPRTEADHNEATGIVHCLHQELENS